MADSTLVVNPDFYKSVDQLIIDVERVSQVVNGDGNKEVVVEDGSLIPSIRKAMIDNLYFKTPPFPWRVGDVSRVYNQLYTFAEPNMGASWWYAPGATSLNVVPMKASPHDDPNWRLIIDTASIADIYAPLLSPVFKGNPRGPTPATADDSTSLATTAFVNAAIATAIGNPGESVNDFFDINVRNKATISKLSVTGESTFKGQIAATTSQMLLNTLRLMADTGRIDFAYLDPAYAGKLRTILTPHTITTSVLTVDKVTAKSAELGDEDNITTDSVIVHGKTTVDYLKLKGNTKFPATKFQLEVPGRASIKDLTITGTLSGVDLTGGVNGKDITPTKVTTDQIDAKIVNVSQTLNVTGDTAVKNLTITGTVTGLTFPDTVVDGKNIKPRSVVTTNDSNFGGRTTVKDLTVTGTVTGISLSVDGEDITPNSVMADQFVVSPLTVTAVTGNFIPDSTRNMQDWLVTGNTLVKPLDTAPKAGSTFIIYIQQDATGGRAVNWDPAYIPLGTGTVNTAANAVTVVQLIYRGTGTQYDLIITPRP